MIMSTKEETKKGGVTMRGKNQNQDTNDPRKIPAEYLDENGNWRMLDRRERAMLTDGQLYAYERYWLAVVDERILREAAAKKGYNEGMQDGIYTVARNMKQMGLPIADIAKAAGLSEKEITKL
jgi:predicted transposase/invertase (TIGR01784 family)